MSPAPIGPKKPVPDRVRWIVPSKRGRGWANVHALRRMGYGTVPEGEEIANQRWLPAMIHPNYHPDRHLAWHDDAVVLYTNGKTAEDLHELYAAARVLLQVRREEKKKAAQE